MQQDEPPLGVLASRWTRTPRWRIHTRASIGGAPEGRVPVVLVHGQVVSSRYMVPLGRHLAPHHPVLAPDLPGYGLSDKPTHALSLAELADTLAEWMDAEGVRKPALVGNSYGCEIIAEFALRHPARLSRAVLQGPTTDPAARTVREQVGRWAMNAVREPPGMGLVLLKDYRDAGMRRSVETFRNLMADPIEQKLPRVNVPALVVRGEHDPIVPQRWAEQAARLLPQGRLVVIPGVAHTINYAAPHAFAQAILPFLRGVGA